MKHAQPVLEIAKNQYEHTAWQANSLVCGIDEVGRGCLAGPLVTAAVMLPPHTNNSLLKDSKTMSATDRATAHTWITQNCYCGIGIIHNRLIDERNVLQATILAMKKALIHALATSPLVPSAILVDAVPLTLFDVGHQTIPVHHFTKGESKSSSIAAASIVAKVTRDNLMTKFATLFPGYHLEEHKGYGSQSHLAAISKHQHSIIHRTSFLNNIDQEHSDGAYQQTIC
jgi:ribonuclease HII